MVITKEEIDIGDKIHEELKKKELPEDPELNFYQRQAIKNELTDSPEIITEKNREEGRKKASIDIVNKIISEERIREKKELEKEEDEEVINNYKLQKKFERRDNEYLFTEFDKFTDYLSIAKSLIKFQPFYYDKHRIWWFWNLVEKKWEIVDETDIMNAIDEKTRNPTSSLKAKYEILESLKRVGRKHKPKEPDKYWIQFKDKIYDLKKDMCFEATPEYFITNPIPHSLGKSEDTPVIDRLMREWIHKDGFQDESYIQTLQEILSYCFLASLPIHRIFCFIGEGLNGKGTFLRLIENFVGDSNKCATEIELLSTHRFESSKLFKKLVCIAGEIDKGIFKKTKTIKSISGEDLIRFEIKGKDGFDGHSYAKILIATNHLPETTDKSDGFYRRWTIVDFPNKFDEKKNVLDEISEEEYCNFCLKSIRILKELIKRGEFTNDGTIQEREDKYEKHCNFINEFINQYCYQDNESHIEFGEFYDKYNEFLISQGLNRKSKMEVSKSLLIKGFEKKVKKTYENISPTTKLCVLGIKFREELI